MVALKGADIEAFVKRPDASYPVVMIFGPDAGLVHERVAAILRASVDDPNDPFALVRLSGDDLAADPARLVDEASTIPLFGGRRAIWVRAGARNFVNALETLPAALNDCRIVIEAGDLKRNAPLRGYCERARNTVAIPCYADGERELGRLIDEEMVNAKARITRDARALLVSLLGGDRQLSRNEIAKLLLYGRDKPEIDADDVLAVIADAAALGLDRVVDAALAGRTAEMETHLLRSRAAGVAPSAMLAAAARQAMQLHATRLAVEGGISAERALDQHQPGLHFRRKPLVEVALRNWTAARLARATAQLADAVLDSRKQPMLAGVIAERALLSLALAAGRSR